MSHVRYILVAWICAGAVALSGDPCAHPNAHKYAAAANYARLAELSYEDYNGDPDAEQPPGPWKMLKASDNSSGLLGNGLQWTLFHNPDTGEVVLSFRGSNMKSPVDWANNIAQGLGPLLNDQLSPQYDEALALATELKGIAGNRVTLVGHSLGGGLAQYAAHRLDLKAYTFNPASVSLTRLGKNEVMTLGGADSTKIQNFMHENDPLYSKVDWVDLATRVGKDTVLTTAGDYPTDGLGDAHSISNMREHLDTFADCFKPKPPEPEPGPGDGDGDGDGDTGGGDTDGGDTGDVDGGNGLPPPTGVTPGQGLKKGPSLQNFK